MEGMEVARGRQVGPFATRRRPKVAGTRAPASRKRENVKAPGIEPSETRWSWRNMVASPPREDLLRDGEVRARREKTSPNCKLRTTPRPISPILGILYYSLHCLYIILIHLLYNLHPAAFVLWRDVHIYIYSENEYYYICSGLKPAHTLVTNDSINPGFRFRVVPDASVPFVSHSRNSFSTWLNELIELIWENTLSHIHIHIHIHTYINIYLYLYIQS